MKNKVVFSTKKNIFNSDSSIDQEYILRSDNYKSDYFNTEDSLRKLIKNDKNFINPLGEEILLNGAELKENINMDSKKKNEILVNPLKKILFEKDVKVSKTLIFEGNLGNFIKNNETNSYEIENIKNSKEEVVKNYFLKNKILGLSSASKEENKKNGLKFKENESTEKLISVQVSPKMIDSKYFKNFRLSNEEIQNQIKNTENNKNLTVGKIRKIENREKITVEIKKIKSAHFRKKPLHLNNLIKSSKNLERKKLKSEERIFKNNFEIKCSQRIESDREVNYYRINKGTDGINKFRIKSPHTISEYERPKNKYNFSLSKINFNSSNTKSSIFKTNLNSGKKIKNKTPLSKDRPKTKEKTEKPKWNNESIIDREEKSYYETKISEKDLNLIKTEREKTDIEVNVIYNKIFDKFYRKLFDPKSIKSRDTQEQIRHYLKLNGKPSYLDDKIKDIKTKIFFIKGIIDFIYPEIIAHKLKVQKEYYENIIKDIHSENNKKLEKIEIKFQRKGIACEELYKLKENIKEKSAENFFPRVQTAMKSDIKIKTQTKNAFRNIVNSQPTDKNFFKSKSDLFTNIDKFYNMRKFNDHIDIISKKILKIEKF